MLVTEIVEQKNNPNRYSVFIDGVFAFGLIMQDILYFKLKEGSEISKETFDYISGKLIYIKAQDAALNYIGYKMRTVAQVRDKLKQLEYAEDIIENVILFLQKYNYVNDFDYACRYIVERERLSPRGPFALKAELRQKGVADKIIDQAMAEAELDEIASAKKLIAKKCRRLEIIDEKEKKRLCAFLQRKGYSYDIIKETLQNFEDGDF